MAANPMTQFEVYRIGPEVKIGSFDISFTNASLFMVISSLAILIIFNLGSKKNSVLPNKIQLLAELSYTFVSKMISDTAGSKAKPYFAFIFSLFMFVLFCNMFGMIPYTFTVTSHIIVTFVLAAFIFIGVTIVGFIKHGFGYLKLFVPSGVPIVLLPLILSLNLFLEVWLLIKLYTKYQTLRLTKIFEKPKILDSIEAFLHFPLQKPLLKKRGLKILSEKNIF